MGEIKLPEPVAWFAEYGGDIYTADQLRAAVEADRERRVVLSDDHIEDLCMELFVTAQGNSSMEEKLARIDAILRKCLPEHKPLTEKEIDSVMRKALGYGSSPSRDDLEFARAIEKAHGIGAKNE